MPGERPVKEASFIASSVRHHIAKGAINYCRAGKGNDMTLKMMILGLILLVLATIPIGSKLITEIRQVLTHKMTDFTKRMVKTVGHLRV